MKKWGCIPFKQVSCIPSWNILVVKSSTNHMLTHECFSPCHFILTPSYLFLSTILFFPMSPFTANVFENNLRFVNDFLKFKAAFLHFLMIFILFYLFFSFFILWFLLPYFERLSILFTQSIARLLGVLLAFVNNWYF